MRGALKFLSLLFVLTSQVQVNAGGISVDAGLTPAQDRFILRTQYRYMSMSNQMMVATTQMVPLVVAYGVTSGFSLMARGMYVHQSFSNSAEVKSGFNDLYLLSKFRVYRKNTAGYVIGIAPHIASNVPVGATSISGRTWNPEVGLNISYRPRFFSIDFSTAFTKLDILKKSAIRQGSLISLNAAFSALIPMKHHSSNAISPVVEMGYIAEGNKRNDAIGDREVVLISPGVSFIHKSLVLEGLVQLPLYQSSSDQNFMDQRARIIIGVKYML